jgi:hypothetical protein
VLVQFSSQRDCGFQPTAGIKSMKQQGYFPATSLCISAISAALFMIAASGCATPATQTAKSELDDGTVYVSPDTSDPVLRAYQDALATHIQKKSATSRVPQGSASDSHGIVLAIVTVGQSGRVEDVHIAQAASSILEQHTEKLIYSIEPLDAFSRDLQARAKKLVFVTRVNYSE